MKIEFYVAVIPTIPDPDDKKFVLYGVAYKRYGVPIDWVIRPIFLSKYIAQELCDHLIEIGNADTIL